MPKEKVMKGIVLGRVIIVLTGFLLCTTICSSNCMAKQMSLRDRQEALMKNVNEGQKTKQLTVKEAQNMRSELADIARTKAKMKRKNEDNKLTSSNKIDLEKDLNKVSVEIKKLRLEKRVDALENKDKGNKKSWWKK